MKIKVCGITSVSQLKELEVMEVDHAGLIFAPSSPRYAREKLWPERQEVKKTRINKVGVFVNEDADTILQTVEEFGLGAVQLHGDEKPELSEMINRQVPVIKAFRVKENENLHEQVSLYKDACAHFLFDTWAGKENYGGTGKSFDWWVLQAVAAAKPFFLSGGIAPNDIEHIQRFEHPFFYGVDINSRFEISPGIKNMEAVKQFVKNTKPENL